jgi:cell division protein FtsW
LIIRGIKIAVNAPDTFGTLAVAGLTTLIAVQFFLNVAVVTSSVPVTGMPLPFFSYGGSALCFLLWSMGIVLNVSRQTKEIKKV